MELTDGERESLAAQAGSAQRVGVTALLTLQHADGSFPFLQREPETSLRPAYPLFSTVSVLLAVGSLMAQEAVSRAAGFIMRCRRPDGDWRFDPALGIPADADTTACALAVLARSGNACVRACDGALLRSLWRPNGGPFQTWRGSGMWAERGRDDAVVNCNVLLALREVGAPGTVDETRAVLRLVQRSAGGSRYYCSPTTIAYAARRAGLPLGVLPRVLTARPRPESGVLASAQWLSAVRRWDADVVAHVLAAQTRNGTWPAEAWCTGQGIRTVWGSRAISTALCVEALQAVLSASILQGVNAP